MTPESLFDDRLANDPTRPLITFYDDASGERAELSAKSLANWVAKTHFMLIDELGLGPGDRAYLSLPVHWLAAPILFGSWFAGLEIVSDPSNAAVAFGDAASLEKADLSNVADVFAVSLLSMARSAEPPRGMSDYAASVRPHPDAWPTVRARGTEADAGLDGLSRAELAKSARASAADLGLLPGGRLLWSAADFTATAWLQALLAPLAVSGSVVLVSNADPAKLASRASAEHVTVIR
ncbi:TIGR03089 family protein [Jatrophihabitans sp. DSM 45814]